MFEQRYVLIDDPKGQLALEVAEFFSGYSNPLFNAEEFIRTHRVDEDSRSVTYEYRGTDFVMYSDVVKGDSTKDYYCFTNLGEGYQEWCFSDERRGNFPPMNAPDGSHAQVARLSDRWTVAILGEGGFTESEVLFSDMRDQNDLAELFALVYGQK